MSQSFHVPDSNSEERAHPAHYSIQVTGVIIFCGLSLILLYARSLNNYFQSDDFILLKWASAGVLSAFRPTHWEFHRPFTIFILAISYKLFSLCPPAFRLILLSFQLANCILLSCLAQRITHNRAVSIVTPLLFAFSFYHCEVLLWISCLADVLATFFCILTLLFYSSYRGRGGSIYFFLSIVSFSCAVLSKESALPLFAVLMAYDFFIGASSSAQVPHPPTQSLLPRTIARYIPFAILIGVSMLFKTPTAVMNPYGKIAVNYTQYILYAFLPFLTTHTQMSWPAPVKILVFSVAAGGLTTIVKCGGPPIRFLIICFLLLLLPPSMCAVAEARYLFAPGCIISIVLASALVDISCRVSRRLAGLHRRTRNHTPLLSATVLTTICLAVIIPQALFVSGRAGDWASASAIVESIIESVRAVKPYSLAGADTYFVNLPDGIPSRLGYAYIFRNGIAEALYFAYGGRVGRIEAVRMAGAEGTWRGHREIDIEALKKLSRGNTNIFVYSPDTQNVKRYGKVGP